MTVGSPRAHRAVTCRYADDSWLMAAFATDDIRDPASPQPADESATSDTEPAGPVAGRRRTAPNRDLYRRGWPSDADKVPRSRLGVTTLSSGPDLAVRRRSVHTSMTV